MSIFVCGKEYYVYKHTSPFRGMCNSKIKDDVIFYIGKSTLVLIRKNVYNSKDIHNFKEQYGIDFIHPYTLQDEEVVKMIDSLECILGKHIMKNTIY